MAPTNEASISLCAFALGNSTFALYLLFSLHQFAADLWSKWWILIYAVWVIVVFYEAGTFFNAMDAYQVKKWVGH